IIRFAKPYELIAFRSVLSGELACTTAKTLNDCQFMKMITLQKIYESLRFNRFEIKLDPAIQERALKPIVRMLELSEKLGIK
ncbi:MAG TPA: quinolinate synthase NadA, partial [Bacteroidales bacterium]|nr:quinolinate synthase NadA [Bacteroidales bacterium]